MATLRTVENANERGRSKARDSDSRGQEGGGSVLGSRWRRLCLRGRYWGAGESSGPPTGKFCLSTRQEFLPLPSSHTVQEGRERSSRWSKGHTRVRGKVPGHIGPRTFGQIPILEERPVAPPLTPQQRPVHQSFCVKRADRRQCSSVNNYHSNLHLMRLTPCRQCN